MQHTATYSIEGYNPTLGEEQAGKIREQLAVVDGENFLFTVRGVHSAFQEAGGARPTPAPGHHPAQFWVKNQRVFLFADGAYLTDAFIPAQLQAPAQTHPDYDLTAYHWSYAYVGTRHWFCHPTHPQLIYYDEFDDEWGLFRDDCWEGPIFSITQADNSLIVLLQDVVVWSKFDEGHRFACEKYDDAGAQSLARIRYGQPFAVMPYNNAWLTFTSKGIMLSVHAREQVPHPNLRANLRELLVGPPIRFTHTDLSYEILPFGPAAIAHMDGRAVVWLAPQGFHAFQPAQGGGFGSIVQKMEIMGRFYTETLVPSIVRRPIRRLDDIALHYVPDMDWIAVSSRAPEDTLHYSRAHVYQRQLDKWGSFNWPHLNFAARTSDMEIALQERTYRYLAAFTPAGLQDYDAQRSHGRSWVRFSPARLVIPEQLPARSLKSVEELRIGVHEPPWLADVPRGLQSSWRTDLAEEVHPSVFRAVLYGGDGPVQITGDEVEYATFFRRANNVVHFTCHVTGVDLSLYVLALREDEHFALTTVEMSYFFAGLL